VLVPDRRPRQSSVADTLGDYYDITVKPRALRKVAVAGGVRSFIFPSTAAVYGMPRQNPVCEDAELKPVPTGPLS
jgi:UDP-glucose 4-epimerase